MASFLIIGFPESSGTVSIPKLMEMVNINVNCTTSAVSVSTVLSSNDTSLMHFPEEANLNDDANLLDAVAVSLGFSQNFSVLVFTFEGIDSSEAKSNADAVKPNIESAFGVSFTYNSTKTHDDQVDITYMGEGRSNLIEYTQWLMDQCLNNTINGFSSTFLTMASEPGAMTNVMAGKEAGSFNWSYTMVVHYDTTITTGMGSHTIDVLELLNVESLAPSPYASVGGYYTSVVNVYVNSNETVTFEGCIPPRVMSLMTRGWYVPTESGTHLTGTFYFGNYPTEVIALTFTFSGVVVSEFTIIPLLAILLITAILVFFLKRKI